MDKGIKDQLQASPTFPPEKIPAQPAKGPRKWPRSAADWVAGKLSRVTTSGELLHEVDGLRFVAITAVVFHHLVSIYLPASGRVPRIETRNDWMAATDISPVVAAAYCGYFGVHLFFVISGFILALPFVRRASQGAPPPSWKSYYQRRLIRIEPPYLICLLGYLIVKVARHESFSELLPHFLASSTYLHGILYQRESILNGVAWSLEVEVQFYLLVPLLMKGLRIRDPRWRRGGLLVAIACCALFSQLVVYPYTPRVVHLTLLNYGQYFLAGILLADLSLTKMAGRRGTLLVGDLLVPLSGAAIVAILLHPGEQVFLLPFLIMLLYAGFHLGRIANRIICWRWLVIIGGMCYTIYLYHTMIISQIFVRTIAKGNPSEALFGLFAGIPTTGSFAWELACQALIVIPILLLLSALLYVITEKPFMRWSGSRGKRDKGENGGQCLPPQIAQD
jgi:peptidoglycan/LPS O-acetylase OafA/YrhL